MQPSQSLLDSIERHERYAAVDATNQALQMALGDLYHQAGRFDDAAKCFQRCLSLDGESATARSRLASVLISQQRFAEAEILLRPLLANEPGNAALQHNLGVALYFQRRFDEASGLFADAASNGLEAPGNYAYLARSRHQLGEMEAAIAAGEQWVKMAPGVRSESYLALLHIDGGDVRRALQLGEGVLQRDESDVDANVAVGSASMEAQQADRAQHCFEIALRQDPENGRAWLGMGLVHLYMEKTDAAVVALANAARIYPENAGIAVTYGWAFIVKKDGAAAEKAFLNAVAVDRTFAEAHAGLAAALALQSKPDQAAAALQLARRLNRDSLGADMAESFLLAMQGKQAAAENQFSKLLQKSPRADVLPLIEQLRIYSSKRGGLGKSEHSGKPH